MASGFCRFLELPQSGYSASSYDWWHSHVVQKGGECMFTGRRRFKTPFPPFPHTFTVAHCPRPWGLPLCLHRTGIGADVEGMVYECGLTPHRAFWEWVHNKSVVPPVRTHWLKVFTLKLRLTCNKIAWYSPFPKSWERIIPFLLSFPPRSLLNELNKGLDSSPHSPVLAGPR